MLKGLSPSYYSDWGDSGNDNSSVKEAVICPVKSVEQTKLFSPPKKSNPLHDQCAASPCKINT